MQIAGYFRKATRRKAGCAAVLGVGMLALLVASGCGRPAQPDPATQSKGQEGSKVSGLEPLSSVEEGIYAHSSVPVEQRELLKTDLTRLGQLKLSGGDDAELGSILGTSDLSGSSLSRWLAERVHTIVGTDFPLNSISEAQEDHSYAPQVFGADSQGLVMVMVNLGTAIYTAGREHDRLYSVNLEGTDQAITTPRVGLLQIGEGLFHSNYRIENHGLDSMGTTLDRLSVLFHEARHSDGNGKNAGFPHQVCPSGHEYAGREQCDSASNGAFALEAALLKTFIRTCEQTELCDAAEIEALRLSFADARMRLIGTLTQLDPRPERVDPSEGR